MIVVSEKQRGTVFINNTKWVFEKNKHRITGLEIYLKSWALLFGL